MDNIKQNRVMGWAVIALVLLNGLALGTLWWTRLGPSEPGATTLMQRLGRGRRGGPGGERGPGGTPDVIDFLERELDFDSDQTLAVRQLRRQFFEDSFQVRHSIHTLKQDMMRTIFASETEATEIEALAQKIGRLHADLEIIQSTHFDKIRALCKPEQKAKFLQLLDDVLMMTRPEAPASPRQGGRGRPQMRGGRRGGPMGEFPRGPGTPPENGF
jgi:hypothetical protein